MHGLSFHLGKCILLSVSLCLTLSMHLHLARPLVFSASLSVSLATCPSLSCSLSHSVNASPSYASARSLCKSLLLSGYMSLALLLSVSLAQCISILLFRLFSLQVDPVRTNPPQSDQTGESFFLTGRFRNYSCEEREFPPGRTVARFLNCLKREVQFSLYRDFTTIHLRGFHP